MKEINTILAEQCNDIKRLLDKVNNQPKSEKQKESTYYVLQAIQNKLDKLIK